MEPLYIMRVKMRKNPFSLMIYFNCANVCDCKNDNENFYHTLATNASIGYVFGVHLTLYKRNDT
jgi:hypothetical protein